MRNVALAVVLACGASAAAIEGDRQAPPVRVGDALASRLDEAVPALLAKTGEPGLAVVLMENCGTRWIKTWGVADRTVDALVGPDTAFQVGSISKTLTAWAVGKLADLGAVDLDRPASTYLKRWRLPASDFDPDRVTPRTLLSHTAGISLPSISGADLGSPLPSLLDELNGRGPSGAPVHQVAAPGEYRYSGGGYAILQLLIEDVTGESFATYLQREVLTPLGMKQASFGWDSRLAGVVAVPYRTTGEPHPHRVFSVPAAAGLYVTPHDAAAFLRAHCADGATPAGAGVISAARLAELIKPAPSSARYGLGYQVFPPLGSLAIVAHDGSNLGWKANFMVAPAAGLGIFVMTNTDTGVTRTEVLKLFRNALVAAAGGVAGVTAGARAAAAPGTSSRRHAPAGCWAPCRPRSGT